MDEQNEKRFESWYKVGVTMNPTEFGDERVIGACLGYMIRMMSKRQIPDPKLVMEALEGKRKIPPCGHLNCFMDDDDHVH